LANPRAVDLQQVAERAATMRDVFIQQLRVRQCRRRADGEGQASALLVQVPRRSHEHDRVSRPQPGWLDHGLALELGSRSGSSRGCRLTRYGGQRDGLPDAILDGGFNYVPMLLDSLFWIVHS